MSEAVINNTSNGDLRASCEEHEEVPGAQWNCGALKGWTEGPYPGGNYLRLLHHRPDRHWPRLLLPGLEEEGSIDTRKRSGGCGLVMYIANKSIVT